MKKLILLTTTIALFTGISAANAGGVYINGSIFAPPPVVYAPPPPAYVVEPAPYAYYYGHPYYRDRHDYDWKYWHDRHDRRDHWDRGHHR